MVFVALMPTIATSKLWFLDKNLSFAQPIWFSIVNKTSFRLSIDRYFDWKGQQLQTLAKSQLMLLQNSNDTNKFSEKWTNNVDNVRKREYRA